MDDHGRTSILVVDDDETLRAVAARVLRRGGLFVVEAADANAAVAALRGGSHIDLVLSDVHMPGRDGFAMALEMRALRPDLVVVFMSGQHGHGEDECAEVGATFVEKPFTPASLRAAVNTALGRAAQVAGA